MNVLRQEQTDDAWDAIRIKAELQRRDLSLAELSRRNGYHANSAARALRISWPEMERIIADALNEKPEELWPDRYLDGVPRKYLPRKQTGG
ncbi:MAG: helix-turn-helix domain-containing protein [Hyphomicrobiales bacterium]|uniref:helix-turn-helix domain-containing protein n=1 Tax=Alphaproteobacteria TaxID=28211 RepID=UPI003298BB00